MSPETGELLMNKEVIAIDQDSLGKQCDRISAHGPFEIWKRQLASQEIAVALFNRGESDYPMTLSLKDLGLPADMHVRDVWRHTDLPTVQGSYTAVVRRHGVILMRLSRPTK
jgi:alpha-galactosidase